jgi:hypothetical protein
MLGILFGTKKVKIDAEYRILCLHAEELTSFKLLFLSIPK